MTGANRIEFLIQGSASEPYRVIIEKCDTNLNAYCTCPAGTAGQSCKHRLAVLSGSPIGILSDNTDQLSVVVDWVEGTDVEAALRQVIFAEDELKRAKQALANAKKQLAGTLRK